MYEPDRVTVAFFVKDAQTIADNANAGKPAIVTLKRKDLFAVISLEDFEDLRRFREEEAASGPDKVRHGIRQFLREDAASSDVSVMQAPSSTRTSRLADKP